MRRICQGGSILAEAFWICDLRFAIADSDGPGGVLLPDPKRRSAGIRHKGFCKNRGEQKKRGKIKNREQSKTRGNRNTSAIAKNAARSRACKFRTASIGENPTIGKNRKSKIANQFATVMSLTKLQSPLALILMLPIFLVAMTVLAGYQSGSSGTSLLTISCAF